MPAKVVVEIRSEKNDDGTYNIVTYEDHRQLVGDFHLQKADCAAVIALQKKVKAIYPHDVFVKLVGPCGECLEM